MSNDLNTTENLEKLARFCGVQPEPGLYEEQECLDGQPTGGRLRPVYLFNPFDDTPQGASDFEQVLLKASERWGITIDMAGPQATDVAMCDVEKSATGRLAHRYAVCEAVLKLMGQPEPEEPLQSFEDIQLVRMK